MTKTTGNLLKVGGYSIVVYAVVAMLVGYGLVNLDNKGQMEPPVQGLPEWSFLSYTVIVSSVLICSAIAANHKESAIRRILVIPTVVLVAQLLYLLPNATTEAVPYILLLHGPLLLGVALWLAGLLSQKFDGR